MTPSPRRLARPHRLLATVGAAALALGLAAQTPTGASSGPLLVQTDDVEIVKLFAAPVDIPLPGPWQVTLDQDAKFKVEVAKDFKQVLVARAQVAAIAAMFRTDLQRIGETIDRTRIAQRYGIERSELEVLLDLALSLPFEIESVEIDIKPAKDKQQPADDNQKPVEEILVGTATITAIAGSRLSTYLEGLTPGRRPLPDLAIEGSLLSLRIDLDPASLAGLLRLVPAFVVGPAGGDAAARQSHRETLARALALLDGTFALTIGADSRTRRAVAGLTDAPALRALLDSDAWRAWRQADADTDLAGEFEWTEGSGEHRGIGLHRRSRRDDAGTRTTWWALVGNRLLATSSGTDAAAQVDSLLDGRPPAGPLPDGAILSLSTRLAELASAFTEGHTNVSDAPERLELTVHRTGRSLELTMTIVR
jgi:hypothetical protein